MNARGLWVILYCFCLLFIAPSCLRAAPNAQERAEHRRLLLERQFSDALDKGDLSQVRRLIDAGVDVNHGYRDGFTPLGIAATQGNPAIVQLLLDRKADVHPYDSLGLTALDYAILSNRFPVFQILLRHGANVNPDHQWFPQYHWMYQTEAPLVLAAQVGNTRMRKILLDAGAVVNAQIPRNGDTALIAASRRANLAAVKLLLTRRADKGLKNKDGATALTMARKKRNAPLIALLSR